MQVMNDLRQYLILPTALVGLALVVGGAYVWYWMTSRPSAVQAPTNQDGYVVATQTNTSTAHWTLYHDVKYGYSFQYPSDWSVIASSDYFQYLLNASGSSSMVSDAIDDGIEVFVSDSGPSSTFSSEAGFVQSAWHYLQGLCIGGTDQSPVYASEVTSESTATNRNGILYDTVYFSAVMVANASGTLTSTSIGLIGPLFAFYIWNQTHGSANMLELLPGGNPLLNACTASSSSRRESPTLHSLIESISF